MPYITPDGNYTESPFVAEGSIEVPERPSASFAWNGTAWVEDFAKLKTAALTKFRADRLQMFFVIANMSDEAKTDGDTATATALDTFRQGLKDLPSWPAVVAATTEAELLTAMSTQYKALVAALPTSQKLYFKELMV